MRHDPHATQISKVPATAVSGTFIKTTYLPLEVAVDVICDMATKDVDLDVHVKYLTF